MTKHRAPLTFDAALARIAGQVPGGFEALATRADRQPRTIRNWGDPDTPEQIPVDVALDFDLAFAEAGGEGSPFLEAFVHQREQHELLKHASRVALAHRAAEVIKECGEAGSALVIAALPGATPRQRQLAHTELVEAFEIIKRTLPMFSDLEPSSSSEAVGQPRTRDPP